MEFSRLQIPGLSPGQCAALARTRKYRMYVRSVAEALAGKCPFCDLDEKFNVVIAKNGCWRAWQSPTPEDFTAHHFIIAHKRHVLSMEELDDDVDGAQFWAILRELRFMHAITSNGVLMRDGDATLGAGSIHHLHGHMMVPNGKGRLESPFYKGDASEAESNARAIAFELMRTGTQFADLSSEQQRLVEDRLE